MNVFFKRFAAIVMMAVFLMGVVSCKKDKIDPPTVKVFDGAITIDYMKASVSAEVTDQGGAEVKSRGIVYGKSGSKQDTVFCGSGLGVFSAELAGLEPNTTYIYEAFALNAGGVGLSGKVTFTTKGLVVPTVKTLEVSEVTTTTAVCRGKVTEGGGASVTKRGVCWSKSHNPTIGDGHVESGEGVGEYTCELTGLEANTTYYVRAYATNSKGTGYGEELTLTMKEEHVVSVSVYPAGSGEVTVSGGGVVLNGNECTVTATAKHGYRFKNWTENGMEVSTEPSYTFTVTGNRTLVVVFTPKSYEIALSANPSSGGTVSGGGSIVYGQTCTAKATRNHGYSFTNWTEDGTAVSTEQNYTFTVTKARKLVANFTPKSYRISLSANPSSGGTVTGGGSVTFGQSCTVTATPADGYRFVNWTEGGTEVSTDASYTFTVSGNRTLVAIFQAQPQVPTGAIDGLFSVSATQQVWFSQGNLKYNGTTGKWSFADHQWDMVGTSQGGNRDLFGWGTSGYNHGAVCYQPWSTSTSYSDYYAYGRYNYNLYDQTGQADWGYNPISNGGNTIHTWRTPTIQEWQYVFHTRSTTSGIRYAKAKVNNINGVILLPDDWSSSYYTLRNTNQDGASFSSNVITAYQWNNILEQHGAVFLPAAGHRYGTSVYNAGSGGRYWSSSYYDSNLAWSVYFNDSNLNGALNYRNLGPSVRLVCSAQ